MKRRIKIKAPASSANLGPGFDAFALALEEPYDILEVELTDTQGLEIVLCPDSPYQVPTNPEENSLGLVAKRALELLEGERGIRIGIRVLLRKGIRPGYGMGSSGASAAGMALALNSLLRLGLGPEGMVQLAAAGEVASAGVEHLDNVAASLLGGFVALRPGSPPLLVSLEPPTYLRICLAIPLIEVPAKKTGMARSILPKSVSLSDHTWNLASASLLALGFSLQNPKLIGLAMQDRIIEPSRAGLIPGFDEVRKAALKAGALGVAISGAGPTVLSLVDEREAEPSKIGEAMRRSFASKGIESQLLITRPGKGVRILEG